mmetsp:Transcript_12817/g.57819  ORF Transcript_12817/g.57819 Transcript_12817/m.57819 type:complete len:424 (+) Transcript_12817:110-1381(+)
MRGRGDARSRRRPVIPAFNLQPQPSTFKVCGVDVVMDSRPLAIPQGLLGGEEGDPRAVRSVRRDLQQEEAVLLAHESHGSFPNGFELRPKLERLLGYYRIAQHHGNVDRRARERVADALRVFELGVHVVALVVEEFAERVILREVQLLPLRPLRRQKLESVDVRTHREHVAGGRDRGGAVHHRVESRVSHLLETSQVRSLVRRLGGAVRVCARPRRRVRQVGIKPDQTLLTVLVHRVEIAIEEKVEDPPLGEQALGDKGGARVDLPKVHLRHELPSVDLRKALAFAADSLLVVPRPVGHAPDLGRGENGALVGVRIATRELRSLAPREPLQTPHVGERRDVFLPRLHHVEIGVVFVPRLLNPFQPALQLLPLAKQAPADGPSRARLIRSRLVFLAKRIRVGLQSVYETTRASVKGLARTRVRC